MKDLRFLWRAGLVAALGAAVANLVVYLIGRAAGVGFSLEMGGSVTQVGAAQVLLLSIVSIVVGTALAALLARRGADRLRWAQAVGAAVAVLSAVGPLSAAAGATGILLAAMHLITGASYVLALQAVRRRSAAAAAEPATTTTRR